MQLTYMNETLANSLSSFTKDENLNPDEFIVFEDVSATEMTKINRLKELNEKSYTTEAEKQEMTQLLTDLRPHMPTSEDWNKFCASLYSMQIYMRDEIVVFVNQKQIEITNLINNHKYTGAWNSTTTYSFGNMVMYGGYGFISRIDNNKGNAPNISINSDTYWLKFTIKGDKGDAGLNTYYKGEYSSTTIYNLSSGDACSYNGSMYYAKTDGIVGVLPTDTTKWQQFQRQPVNIIQSTDSTTRQSGVIYFVVK